MCNGACASGRANIEVVGRVDGHILFEERGENGFGYDNMFLYEPFGLSFAEIDAERKNGVSHRLQSVGTGARCAEKRDRFGRRYRVKNKAKKQMPPRNAADSGRAYER